MSFGAEMRDFTAAMTGVTDAYNKIQVADYYRRNRGKTADFSPEASRASILAGGTGDTGSGSDDGEDRYKDTPVGFIRDELGLGPKPSPATAASQAPTSVTPPPNTASAAYTPSSSPNEDLGPMYNRGGLVTRVGNWPKPTAIPTDNKAYAFGGSVTGGRVGARPLPRAYSPSPAMQSAVPSTVAGGGPVAAAGMPIMARRFQEGGSVDDQYPDDIPPPPQQPPAPPPPPAATPAQPTPTTAGAPAPAQPPADTSPATTPPAPAAAASPPPPPAQPAPAATGAPAAITPGAPQPTAATQEPERDDLSSALHGAVTWLQNNLKLTAAVPGTPPSPEGKAALLNGYGAATPDDVKAARNAIDPNKDLSDDVVNIRVLNAGYKYYLMHGDVERANRYAASLVQYAVNQASQYGEDALNALQRGDIKGAVGYLQHGNNQLPTGQNVENVNIKNNGTVTLDQKDTRTGKVTPHSLTPQDLYGLALGLKDRSASWQSILGAAGTVKGANVPMTDAEAAATNAANAGTMGGPPDQTGATTGGETAPTGGAPGAPSAGGGYTPRSVPTALPNNVTPDVKAAFDTIPAEYKPLAMAMAQGESSFQANPKPGSADAVGSAGLFQFTPATWKQVTGQDIPKEDQRVPGKDPRLDPKASAAAFIKLAQQNSQQLQRVLGRPPTPGEIAMAHQQGAGGAIALIRADPNSSALGAIQQQLMATGVPPGEAHYIARKRLSANGVDPNATAAQAMQRIMGTYGYDAGKGGQAVTAPAGAPGGAVTPPGKPSDIPVGTAPNQMPQNVSGLERSMGVMNYLPQDAPQVQPPPAQPTFVRLSADQLSGIPPDRRQQVIAQVNAENARRQKEYADAMTGWKADLTNLKTSGAFASPKPMSRTDMGTFVKQLDDIAPVPPPTNKQGQPVTGPIDAIWADKNGKSTWRDISPAARDTARELALDIASYDPRITAVKALQQAHTMLHQDKSGEPLPYEVHRMPDGKTYRIFNKNDGEQFLISSDKLGEIALIRGDIGYQGRTRGVRAKADAAADEARGERKWGDVRGIGRNIAGDVYGTFAPPVEAGVRVIKRALENAPAGATAFQPGPGATIPMAIPTPATSSPYPRQVPAPVIPTPNPARTRLPGRVIAAIPAGQ